VLRIAPTSLGVLGLPFGVGLDGQELSFHFTHPFSLLTFTLGPEGLVLAPAYDIDFTPFENIAAFVEETEAFGRNKA